MITVAIFILLGFIIGCFLYSDMYDDDIWEWLCVITLHLLNIIAAALVGIIIALIIPHNTSTIVTEKQLEAIHTDNTISARFFLGSGSIDGKNVYNYFYHSDGGFRMGQIDAEKALIKYSEVNPKIAIHQERGTDAFVNLFSIFANEKHAVSYEIYIPHGSIKQNYKLN